MGLLVCCAIVQDELFTLILEKYYSYVEIRRKSGGSPAEVVRRESQLGNNSCICCDVQLFCDEEDSPFACFFDKPLDCNTI